MRIEFAYSLEKDIWCLLNKGKSSNNSPNPTKVYQELVLRYGENPTSEETSKFIEEYLSENNIDTGECIARFQKDWEKVANEYQKRAEAVFQVSLPKKITAYLTTNNRCPYNIEENYFYVSMSTPSPVVLTIMHELWHFYTWYSLGVSQYEKLGKERYNDIKESLTVLLNSECADLFPKGTEDKGYPQHQEMRAKISNMWISDKNLQKIIAKLIEFND